MFRITRGITIEHAPAFPNPCLRFPDGTPLPIYGDDEPADAPDQPLPSEIVPATTSNTADMSEPNGSGEAPSTAPS